MLKRIDAGIGCHHPLREIGIAPHQGVDRIGDEFFGKPAHFRDQARDLLQIDVERLGGVFLHDHRISPN